MRPLPSYLSATLACEALGKRLAASAATVLAARGAAAHVEEEGLRGLYDEIENLALDAEVGKFLAGRWERALRPAMLEEMDRRYHTIRSLERWFGAGPGDRYSEAALEEADPRFRELARAIACVERMPATEARRFLLLELDAICAADAARLYPAGGALEQRVARAGVDGARV
jgi:hypothetical protein